MLLLVTCRAYLKQKKIESNSFKKKYEKNWKKNYVNHTLLDRDALCLAG